MRLSLCLCIILLTASQLAAETYSWVDDAGTKSFSDDYNSIPKKYRKKVRRLEDSVEEQVQPREKFPERSETPGSKPAGVADADRQLYDGKTHAAWRKELEFQETELKRLELRLDQIQEMLKKPSQFSRERQTELFKEYETVRVEYNDKYKIYSDLIESARKAGVKVEIKK